MEIKWVKTKISPRHVMEHLEKFCRYSDAWNLCHVMDSKECWLQLAVTALTNLNIEKGENED